jgi:hypothetical protein
MTAEQHPAGLEFFTPAGELVSFPVRYEPEVPAPGREPVVIRRAVLKGRPVIQYRLARSAAKDRRAREALEREVRAALALTREYKAERHRMHFARFAGHNLDASEPFVLYADNQAPGAEPLARCAGRLGVEQLRTVMAQLTRVVRLLGHAGFVHRALAPQTVWWDGRSVRIAGPYAALPAGVPREPYGWAPWSAPEQRSGRGTADSRDDLWSAVQLMYFVVSGRPAEGTGQPPDLAAYSQLAALHDSGVFAARADRRPHAADVLRLLGEDDPLTGAVGAADPLERYRDEFERLLADKRSNLSRGPYERPAAEPAGGPADGPADSPADAAADRDGTLLVTPNGWSIRRGLRGWKGGDQ